MRRIGLVLFDTASTHLSGNGDLNLNTGLDVDDDLLDDLSGGVKARGTSQYMVQRLGRCSGATHSMRRLWILISKVSQVLEPSPQGVLRVVILRFLDGALDAEVLGLCAVDELGADLLEGLNLAGGEGDADLVDLGGIGLAGLLGVLERHFW
jgi:hypothetical protein